MFTFDFECNRQMLLLLVGAAALHGPDLDESELRFEKKRSEIPYDVKFDPFKQDSKFIVKEEIPDEESVDPEIKALTEFIEKSRSREELTAMMKKCYREVLEEYKTKFINLFLDDEESRMELEAIEHDRQMRAKLRRAPTLTDIKCEVGMSPTQCQKFRKGMMDVYKKKLQAIKCPTGLTDKKCNLYIKRQTQLLRRKLLSL